MLIIGIYIVETIWGSSLCFLPCRQLFFANQQVVKIGTEHHPMSRGWTDWKLCHLFPVYLFGCSPSCLSSKRLCCLPAPLPLMGSEVCFFIFPDPWDLWRPRSASRLLGNSLQIQKCLDGELQHCTHFSVLSSPARCEVCCLGISAVPSTWQFSVIFSQCFQWFCWGMVRLQ